MSRTFTRAILVFVVAATAATGAAAQNRRKIPVTEDIRQLHKNDGPAFEPGDVTGSIRPAPPHAQSDPSGVAGFNGPPGIVGDSVGSYGPLPSGAPGNDVW